MLSCGNVSLLLKVFVAVARLIAVTRRLDVNDDPIGEPWNRRPLNIRCGQWRSYGPSLSLRQVGCGDKDPSHRSRSESNVSAAETVERSWNLWSKPQRARPYKMPRPNVALRMPPPEMQSAARLPRSYEQPPRLPLAGHLRRSNSDNPAAISHAAPRTRPPAIHALGQRDGP